MAREVMKPVMTMMAHRSSYAGNSLSWSSSLPFKRWIFAVAVVVCALSRTLIEDPLTARSLIVADVYLTLWFGEAVPPYVPTFVL